MNYDNMMAIHSIELQEENGKLKSKIRELERENCEIKAENKELKEKLQHYKNTEAIQKSNDASRWKPGCMKYVDMELNHF